MTTSSPQLTDEQLMAEVQRGHRWALNSLYARFANKVYGMALQKLGDPAEAQGVTHDIFVNLWQSSGAFRPDGGNLANWLLTIAHNRINHRFRQNRRSGKIQENISRDPSVEPGAPEAGQEERLARVAPEGLGSLPDEQREVVVLSYYRGNSQAEISQRLGVPLATVKTRMRLALASLRSAFNVGGTK